MSNNNSLRNWEAAFLCGLRDGGSYTRANRMLTCWLSESSYWTGRTNWRCRDAWCPSCTRVKAAQVAQLIEQNEIDTWYMVTCTWRQAVFEWNFQTVADERRKYIVSMARLAKVEKFYYKLEVTQRDTGGFHLHYHTIVQKNPDRFKKYFNAYLERYSDVRQGKEVREVLKYLSADLDYKIGNLVSTTRRMRTSGHLKMKLPKPIKGHLDWLENMTEIIYEKRRPNGLGKKRPDDHKVGRTTGRERPEQDV